MSNAPETTDDEIRQCLRAAGQLAALMRCRLVPIAWKLRAAGASEALIEELLPADGSVA